MHSHTKQQIAQMANSRLMQLDFHDFLEKSMVMQDVELSDDLGLTVDEVRLLKQKWSQSKR
ncbi:hypothetical protein LSG31_12685 [Fodinisporobacter ferrooxydans]|uniref:Uncharacterized protein n=1 Tax=Fodinisporobacter ferrooxydans TaxID=2901836 RepID=A0ABY4CLU7_9BACL|nr:hypothetical protein LSG31_12685 [Alicyclobacillaceae bacterium MYW30-H2]